MSGGDGRVAGGVSYLVYLRALAGAASRQATRGTTPPKGRTVERLDLLQKPLEPRAGEAGVDELGERGLLVHARVVRELGALDEREDDRVLEPGEHRADVVERERIAA